jgi:hypothetical protein
MTGAKQSGWVTYAMTMFIVAGVLNVFYGLVMLINDEWVVFGATEVFYIDISIWGWITLLLGALALWVAAGISQGKTWAQILGITAAALHAVNAFMTMPYYPVWSLVMLALALLLIWALTVHGDEVDQPA